MIDVLTKDKFSHIVETIVQEGNIPYMDAIVHWCETNEMEIETAAKLVSPLIKEKLKTEAQDLNFLEKTARLPI